MFFDAWCRRCQRDKSMREGADLDECDDNELCEIIAAANPSAILELIAAYKEAVAALVISRPFINAWPQCRDNELVIVDSALATAKRLGVE